MRSVPTKIVPRATAGALYLPPTFNCAGVLLQSTFNVKASRAYRIGCGTPEPISDWLRSTLATCTQTMALLDPLLVTMGEPGVSRVSVFSSWSMAKKAGCPGDVMIFIRATHGGMVVVEFALTLVEPVMKTKLVPSAAR